MAVAAALLLSNGQAGAVSTSASAAILMDGESGRVLYAQNADQRRPIASITKLMTALVAVETNPDLAEEVQILPEYVGAEGSSIYLKAGETVTLETLLYGLLLQSGNDAALAVAGFCAGDVDTFVSWMNERAESLGMTNTHFCNPNGLHEEEHYSTAADMARLAQVCLKNNALQTILRTKSISIGGRTFTNHNKLLWRYEGCIGLKTGFTEAAGRTLVSAAERDGMVLIAVTLNDGNDWADHAALFDYGFAHWKQEVLAEEGKAYAALPVTGSIVRFAQVVCADHLSCVKTEEESITWKVELPEQVAAPVQKGQIAGNLTFYLDGEPIGSTYLLYQDTIPSALQETGLLERALQFLKSGKRGTMTSAFQALQLDGYEARHFAAPIT